MALIDEFRKQTKETVLEYMDKLGLNRVVYSSLVKGFEPYLEERNLLFIFTAPTWLSYVSTYVEKMKNWQTRGIPYFLMILNIIPKRVLVSALYFSCLKP